MKILVVDDEELIRSVIKEYLTSGKDEVIEGVDGKDAIDKANNNDIDLIIMDIMMSNMDCYYIVKEIFKNKKVPVIMLSARGEEYDKLLGFDMGIEDYMTKPFSPKELVARVKVVLKRNTKVDDNFKYKNITIDFKAHQVFISGVEAKLTPKEYELLLYFINNKNIALSREQLLNKVWGYDFYGDDRTIDTHIKMLRNNLRDYRDMIVTVRGVGYRFEMEEQA